MKNNYFNKNVKIKYILIFLLLIIYLIFIFKKSSNSYKGKVCICIIAKDENKYIREWTEHYKNYGVDKIYLYDNNDINGENFESVIDDYIKEGFVEIFNWRGKIKIHYKFMNDCYNRNNKNYDWLIFYELDEFIHLSNFTNVKPFLNEKKFEKCEIIYLNLIVHNDNNQLFYQNISLFKRFPNIYVSEYLQVKMIIKGGINDIRIKTTAQCSLKNNEHKILKCDGFGRPTNIIEFSTKITDYKYNYIDHFFCKSTEEFTNKLARGDSLQTGKNLEIYKLIRIKRYFKYNNFTYEKLKMMEKSLVLKDIVVEYDRFIKEIHNKYGLKFKY